MPSKETAERARRALRAGKRPSTAAGEFVHEEIEHVREGKHGARSTRQAIAIGLSKARRAGIPLKPPGRGQASERTRRSARRDAEVGSGERKRRRPSAKRSRASRRALEREGHSAASHTALARHAKAASRSSTGRKRSSRSHARPAGGGSGRSSGSRTKRWSQHVTETSHAMDLEPRVFAMRDPRRIAESLMRSAGASRTRKSDPYRSAMSMLTFYINRAGKRLKAPRRRVLERAKDELRQLHQQEAERGAAPT
jgi:hypothetical protein